MQHTAHTRSTERETRSNFTDAKSFYYELELLLKELFRAAVWFMSISDTFAKCDEPRMTAHFCLVHLLLINILTYIYKYIYIYMFLNGFHSPVAGSSEARACIGFVGLAEKHAVTATCLRGPGRDRQRHHLISLCLVALFSHSPPPPPAQLPCRRRSGTTTRPTAAKLRSMT